jgi:transporter family-2 protein
LHIDLALHLNSERSISKVQVLVRTKASGSHCESECVSPLYTGEHMNEFVQPFLFSVLAVLAGMSFMTQQAVNADLRASIESAAWAGFISYLGGTLCMALLALLMRESWPAQAALARSHWWAWSGGLFGAIYIAISILLLPRLGAGTVVALIVLGQMLGSLLFDHYGWAGLPRHSADWQRMVGVALLIGGVVLVRR